MSDQKHLFVEFTDLLNDIKVLYGISTEKQNRIANKLETQINKIDDGFLIREEVIKVLNRLVPKAYVSAKLDLDGHSKNIYRKMFSDQIEILRMCVLEGWDGCGNYPFWIIESIITVNDCIQDVINDLNFPLEGLTVSSPDLAKEYEVLLFQTLSDLPTLICQHNHEFDKGFVVSLIELQKTIFINALRGEWDRFILLPSNNMSKQQTSKHKPSLSIQRPHLLPKVHHCSVAGENSKGKKKKSGTLDFQLCDANSVEKVLSDNKKLGPSDKLALKRLQEKDGVVTLSPLSAEYLDVITTFRVRFPHMQLLADEIESNLCLLSLGSRGVPMELFHGIVVLDGDPGVGKTVALYYLAEKFGLANRIINCAELSNGFDITGSSSTWSGGKPGHIANVLIGDQSPNAMIVLDELDKMVSCSNSPPENALYSLLEKESAKRFRDEFFNIELNASMLNWAGTSNYYTNIPAPIRDRAKRIIIPTPDELQRKVIANHIYKDVRAERLDVWGKYFVSDLSEDVISMIASEPEISIRAMKQIIYNGFSMAARFEKASSVLNEASLQISEELVAKSIQQYREHNVLAASKIDYQKTSAGFVSNLWSK